MPRLARCAPIDPDKQRIARELLDIQAQVRARTMHDGYFARLAYDAGVPVTEIADTYGVTQWAIYKLIERVPDCYNQHGVTDTCTACGTVPEVK